MSFGLSETALASIRNVISRHSGVREAVVFGSRALGREHSRSDIDIALAGDLQPLDAEGIALELEELPLPFHFDVHVAKDVRRHPALREHIDRVGQTLYRRKSTRDDRGSLRGIDTSVPRDRDRV
jgi:predicted nucleotidyltransferase